MMTLLNNVKNWVKKKIYWIFVTSGFVGLAYAASFAGAVPNELPDVVPVFVDQLLEGLSASEKARVKSAEISKLNFRGEYVDQKYKVRVDIQSLHEIEGGIEIFARAWAGPQGAELKRVRDKKDLEGNVLFDDGGNPVQEHYVINVPANTQFGFGKDGSVEIERFRIFNPPILVPDPNGDILRRDEQGNVVRRLREDVMGAVREDLASIIRIVARVDGVIVEGKRGSTTTTVRPVAGANSPADGEVDRASADENFATIIAGAATNADVVGTADNINLDASTTTDQYQQLRRAGLNVDASAIDDGDTVDTAVFSLYTHSFAGAETLGSTNLVSVAFTPAGTNTIVTADFAQFGSTDLGNINFATWGGTEDDENTITLNATGRARVSLTAVSSWGWMLDWDRAASFGGVWGSGLKASYHWKSADASGTTVDPKLVITHSAASGPANLKTLNTAAAATVKTTNTAAQATVKTWNTVQ